MEAAAARGYGRSQLAVQYRPDVYARRGAIRSGLSRSVQTAVGGFVEG